MGLRGKTIIWLGMLSLCSLLLIGGVTYYQGANLAIKEVLNNSQEKIEKDSFAIEHAINRSRTDLMVLAKTPPVQGIIRTKDNRGIDPLTGVKTEYWYTRLEQIFTAFLTYHDEYYQLRYIDEKGNEIVRTDSDGKTVKIINRSELQNKAQYPYFTETIKIREGEVYYSDLNLNREYGKIQVPHTPVMRIATTVYDGRKKVRGIIIINLYAKHIFKDIKQEETGIKKYIINQDGHFLFHHDIMKVFGFDLGFDYTIKDILPEITEELKLKGSSFKYYRKERHIDGFRKIFFAQKDKNRYWAIVYEVPESIALVNIFKARDTMLAVGALIVTVSIIIITWAVSKRIISPVVKLADAAKKMEQGDLSVRIPEKSVKDEFRTLYHAINSFAEAQRRSIEELEEKVKERTAELEEAKMLADNASRAKSDFLANISHELRTPLNSIIGFSELMLEGMAGDMTDQQKEYINDIHIGGGHLLSLIDEILDLSKVEAGKMELELSRFSLRECCESSAGMFREKAKKHGIKLSLDISEDMDEFITADERKTKQVMFNLIHNS